MKNSIKTVEIIPVKSPINTGADNFINLYFESAARRQNVKEGMNNSRKKCIELTPV
ncbi:MAG: hypothetical protein UHY90_02755 [Treponema sp.]|nr:hypothetical protein [Spirochaetia bacterium]MDD7459625.1 hypothetical protein [Spirochaetales bacterium]MDY5811617.1 hypothetical protein [Treponema sp.]MEE1181148.1 hypothetical protein [Treponema sp.]